MGIDVFYLQDGQYRKIPLNKKTIVKDLKSSAFVEKNTVYLKENDYKELESLLKKDVSRFKLLKKEMSLKKDPKIEEEALKKVSEFLTSQGEEEKRIESFSSYVAQITTQIGPYPTTFNMLKKYVLQCKEGFHKDLLTAYLLYRYIELDSEKGRDQRTEGLLFSVLVSNIALEFQDFLEIELGNLPGPVREHPEMIVKTLDEEKYPLSEEQRHCILDHQELPDGSGYPRGVQEKDFSSIGALHSFCALLSEEWYSNENSLKDSFSKLEKRFSSERFREFNRHGRKVFFQKTDSESTQSDE